MDRVSLESYLRKQTQFQNLLPIQVRELDEQQDQLICILSTLDLLNPGWNDAFSEEIHEVPQIKSSSRCSTSGYNGRNLGDGNSANQRDIRDTIYSRDLRDVASRQRGRDDTNGDPRLSKDPRLPSAPVRSGSLDPRLSNGLDLTLSPASDGQANAAHPSSR